MANWYYKAQWDKDDTFQLLTEGPSTFLALHFASMIFVSEELEPTLELLATRYPLPNDAWESVRSAFNRYWPDRRRRLIADLETLEQNRSNGSKGGRPRKDKPEPESAPDPGESESAFDASFHEDKTIWPVWVKIRQTFPGSRIKDWDFLHFEAEVNGGADPQYILDQTIRYKATLSDKFTGYHFEKWIREGYYKGDFSQKNGMAWANAKGAANIDDFYAGKKGMSK